MDASRSINSSSRAHTTDQRGFALIAALVLAILYFGLVELLMLDASRELAEARQFRARIVALTLAENGAELAAAGITNNGRLTHQARMTDWQGTFAGSMRKSPGGQFEIEASGTTAGTDPTSMTVQIKGRVTGNRISIDYATHD